MNKKFLISTIIILILISTTAIFLLNSQETVSEKELDKYESAITIFYLNADYSSYEETNDPQDIKVEPSNVTESIVERWRALTEAYPEAGYPVEAVEQEDWLKAGERYLQTNGNRSQLVSDISETFPEESPQPVARSFNDYIQLGEVFNEELKERMIEEGLEFKD